MKKRIIIIVTSLLVLYGLAVFLFPRVIASDFCKNKRGFFQKFFVVDDDKYKTEVTIIDDFLLRGRVCITIGLKNQTTVVFDANGQKSIRFDEEDNLVSFGLCVEKSIFKTNYILQFIEINDVEHIEFINDEIYVDENGNLLYSLNESSKIDHYNGLLNQYATVIQNLFDQYYTIQQ